MRRPAEGGGSHRRRRCASARSARFRCRSSLRFSSRPQDALSLGERRRGDRPGRRPSLSQRSRLRGRRVCRSDRLGNDRRNAGDRGARPARRIDRARFPRIRRQSRRRSMDALDRPDVQRLGVRRGDRGATDHACAGRDCCHSAAARGRNRRRRHRRPPVRDLARRLLPRPHDFHRQVVRRPTRRRGLVSGARPWAAGLAFSSAPCSSARSCRSSAAHGSGSGRAPRRCGRSACRS